VSNDRLRVIAMLAWILEWPIFYELSQKNILTAGMRRVVLALLRREGADGAEQRVVEVGCGTGLYLTALSPAVFGTDISVPYVRFLRGKGRRVFASDGCALPLRSGSVGFIYCVNVFHHLNDDAVRAVLGEMWRACHPGGTLVVVDIVHPPSRGNRLGRVLRRLDRGGFVRQREQFSALVQAWAHALRAEVVFTDLHSYPQDAVIATVRKGGDARA
jgi:SAM-dependent methyltransferase